MHYGNGFPVLGLTGVDVPYPFSGANVYFTDGYDMGANVVSATDYTAAWKLGGLNATAAATSILPIGLTAGTPPTASETVNGWFRLITTGSSGDECFLQLNSQIGYLAFASDGTGLQRQFVFQTRFRVNTITTSNQFFGMMAADAVTSTGTDPIDTQAVGCAIVIASGVVSYQYKTSATTVATTAASYVDTGVAATVTAATIHTVTIAYNGTGTISFYLDGRLLKAATVPTFTATALSPCIGIDTASAAAKSVDIDYVYAASSNNGARS